MSNSWTGLSNMVYLYSTGTTSTGIGEDHTILNGYDSSSTDTNKIS